MGALFQRLQNGEVIEPFCSPNGKYTSPSQIQLGGSNPTFAGTLAMNNPIGTIWPTHNQAGALVITVDEDAVPGGCDSLRIVADGNTITLDPAFTWVNIGTDSIGVVAADVNELIFFAKFLTINGAGLVTGGTILYSVKLNP
jgi:hypothetical protein